MVVRENNYLEIIRVFVPVLVLLRSSSVLHHTFPGFLRNILCSSSSRRGIRTWLLALVNSRLTSRSLSSEKFLNVHYGTLDIIYSYIGDSAGYLDMGTS